MKKKFSVFCCAIAVFAFTVTVLGVKLPETEIKNDVSYAVLEQYYDDADDMNTTIENEPTEETSASGGSSSGLGDILGGIGGSGDFGGGFLDGIGGIGGIFGDAGDVLGGLLGGVSGSGSSNGVLNTTTGGNDYIYIDPVPAATQPMTKGETIVQPATPTQSPQSTVPVADTIDPNAKTNPYARPSGEIKPGDMGDGVKWIQWNIIYSGYALKDKEITGVYDDETVEAVKKLQAENGLTADGIVNDAVLDKIELLYFEHIINGQPTSAQTPTVGASDTGTVGTQPKDDGSNALIIIIAIVLVAFIWIIAIIVIAIMLISKKKRAKKTAPAEATSQDAAEKSQNENKTGEMSLSDLFEEANNKKK